MVTITNGSTVLTVTKGAYNSMYAPQGWEIVGDFKIKPKTDDFSSVKNNGEVTTTKAENRFAGQISEPKSEENDYDADEDVDLSEIPLSEMSVPQLKLYAKQLGIEVNTDSARQLRTQIKKVLEG